MKVTHIAVTVLLCLYIVKYTKYKYPPGRGRLSSALTGDADSRQRMLCSSLASSSSVLAHSARASSARATASAFFTPESAIIFTQFSTPNSRKKNTPIRTNITADSMAVTYFRCKFTLETQELVVFYNFIVFSATSLYFSNSSALLHRKF